MKVIITGDSTLDLTAELLEKYEIRLLPLEVNLGDNSYKDGVNITREDIYNYERTTGKLPKTSAISVEEYKEVFESYTSQGYEVIHFNISNKLSVSNSNAITAAAELKGVYVIDTLALSTGSALLAIYARELLNQGLSAKETVEKVNKRIPYVQTSFIIDTLQYLYKGGRCTKLQLLGANLLKIKPTIYMDDGKLEVGKKFRGPMLNVILSYVDHILETYNNPDTKRVFVTHTDAPKEIVDMVRQRLREKFNFEEILETTAGATVTAHCGKGTLGILYINDGGVK